MNSFGSTSIIGPGRTCLILMLASCLLILDWTVILPTAQAVDMKLLTPPAGAKIMARSLETHLVLAGSGPLEGAKVVVGKTGAEIEPSVVEEGEDQVYLHFRVPLQPGPNRFTVVPGGLELEIDFKRIQADLNLKTLDSDLYSFHQGGNLPENCQDCHDLFETESIEPVGLKRQTSCAACHSNLVEQNSWQHSTTVNQQCLSCHQQSDAPDRIGLPAENIRDLCLACHTGKKDWLSRKSVHGVLALGGCTLCHDPHAGKHRYQLWAEGSLELCITCHGDKQNLVSKVDRVPVVHGILSGAGCTACHDPHATDHEYMLRSATNDLCFGCHPRQAAFKNGHPVPRHPVEAPVEYLRAGRQLTCASCHEPHGSSHQSMLIETIRGTRLCRECHDK